MEDSNDILNEVTTGDYKYGFVTDIDTEVIHRGLDEETVRIISAKKNEPEWLLEFRLKAFRHWQTLEMPTWPHLNIPPIDYQDIIYYAAPKKKEGPKSLDEVDPEHRTSSRCRLAAGTAVRTRTAALRQSFRLSSPPPLPMVSTSWQLEAINRK